MNHTQSSRPSRNRSLAGASAAVATLAAVGMATFPGSAGAVAAGTVEGGKPGGVRPTIVLEHGAFADASSWNGVIERLRKSGYPVIATANPLRGPASDAAYLRSVLDTISGPVVLVGHSYGGTVITNAAVGNEDKVKALVYIAAFIPDQGESSLELSNKYPGSTLGNVIEATSYTLPDGTTGNDLRIKADKFRQQFAADVPRGQAALMAATQRPIAAAALEEKATKTAWKTIPAWSLIATQDLNIPPAAQRYMSDRAHAHTSEIKASHAVSVSQPDAVSSIIQNAAHATTR
ncbi:alpha/beta fold hydrolase [Streptomyces cupreus]|uniref:Alpha/beta hydrolase n=1 Tax=Streptomyces cupreus TaxID=2759956 RepID=A0A7X1J5Q8_9ACTN|nr:alpha/beta hydrolase [Streptomyces cupreus]MBC2904679.1 alpha/beta hydrolase [Streptomyces cupreus]